MTDIDLKRPSAAFDLDQADRSESSVESQKTVVVFGVPRGGTTMIAGITQRCGVDMGESLPVNLEDQEFVGKSVEAMAASIAERNRTKGTWGWKFPRAAGYLPALQQHLRNPHYIIVWRDIFATGLRGIKKGGSLQSNLRWAVQIQQQNIDVLAEIKGPKLLVSYEKAVVNPLLIAEDISQFLGHAPTYDERELVEFAEPGSYKS